MNNDLLNNIAAEMNPVRKRIMANEVPSSQIFYISLVRGLVGYYVKVLAPSEETVRKHCAKYFGRIWCSVYSYADFSGIRERSWSRGVPCEVFNNDNPVVLTSEEGDWE